MTDILIQGDSGNMFSEKSIEELEKMLNGEIPIASEETPTEPETNPEPETETPAAEPVESEPQTEAEPDQDLAKMELEADRIAREKLEAKLAIQEAHSSRLAGEIGHLRKMLEVERSKPTEPYQPETEVEYDRLKEVERRQAEMEARVIQAQVAQAAEQAVRSLDVADNGIDLTAEIKEVTPKYEEQFKSILKLTDVELARQMASAIAHSALADAKELAWQKRHKELVARKAATVPKSVMDKKAASVSASGAVPAPPPKQKSYGDMTTEELDNLLRQMSP